MLWRSLSFLPPHIFLKARSRQRSTLASWEGSCVRRLAIERWRWFKARKALTNMNVRVDRPTALHLFQEGCSNRCVTTGRYVKFHGTLCCFIAAKSVPPNTRQYNRQQTEKLDCRRQPLSEAKWFTENDRTTKNQRTAKLLPGTSKKQRTVYCIWVATWVPLSTTRMRQEAQSSHQGAR
jgi:hypothetical protein